MADAKTAPKRIRDRVVALERHRAGDLIPHPANWRTHPDSQKAALSGALRQLGFAGAVLTRRVGKKLQIIDGHARAELAHDVEVPCLVTDLSAEEAELLLATYDPIAALAGRNEEALAALLGRVKAEDAALAKMLAEMAPKEDAPLLEGGAESQIDGVTFSVIVDFDNEQDQARLLKRLEKEGYKCRLLIS